MNELQYAECLKLSGIYKGFANFANFQTKSFPIWLISQINQPNLHLVLKCPRITYQAPRFS